jgi:hypothetical protein
MEFKHLRSRSTLLIVSIVAAAFLTRLFLFLNPGAGGSTVLGVHIHHLLVGIVLVCIGGVPAVLLRSDDLLKSVGTSVFGLGIGLALDEWVLFVIRETAPDTPYMSASSLAGAILLVALVSGYVVLVGRFLLKPGQRMKRNEGQEGA